MRIKPGVASIKQRHRARLIGSLAIAVILCAGGGVGHAAEASMSAPDRLPREVVGVVGSGDDLRLQLKAGEQSRVLRLGDEYDEGWRLRSLSPFSAVLIRNGESREIGLNPTGALAGKTAAAPTTVTVAGMPTPEQFAAYFARAKAEGMGAPLGLTEADSRRYTAYEMMILDYNRANHPDRAADALPSPEEAVAAFSQTVIDDYLAIGRRAGEANVEVRAMMTPEDRQAEIDIANHWNQVAEQLSKLPEGDPQEASLRADLNATSKLLGSPSVKYWNAYVPKPVN